MGHVRLGVIPKTQKWESVVSLIASSETAKSDVKALSDNVREIAKETLNAAQLGLERAKNDFGLQYTFYLLTQIVLATRNSDWQKNLENIGINLSESATIAGTKQLSLFGNSRDEIISMINQLSTKKGFSQLGQIFFGRFMARFLNFYLSRVTAANLNTEQLRTIGELTRFNEILERHCEQSAKIIYDFCGQWYSKTEFQEGINLENSSKFIAVALKKLQTELKQQEADI